MKAVWSLETGTHMSLNMESTSSNLNYRRCERKESNSKIKYLWIEIENIVVKLIAGCATGF
jgi:hypothetical protein